ncbi:MAG: hypothetical protein KIY12_02765 [Thermoplasmata archaeon]|uniref:Cell division protein FtsZ n=1 Tax=Candidatus Sysuiplasma superficiale TaxID=2823368 RepID=A0A8J7YR26_9ARCH|nr:hypothetical protein [Candidatus Sysuiplasma superficiale]
MARISLRKQGNRPLRALTVSCGGGGRNIANALKGDMISVDTSAEADLRMDAAAISVSDMDSQFTRYVASPFTEGLKKAMIGHDAVFAVAGLGGLAGGVAVETVAKLAAVNSLPCIASVALPFNVEGSLRRTEARKALNRIGGSASITIPFENNMIVESVPSFNIMRALAVMNRIIASPLLDIGDAGDALWSKALIGRHFMGTYTVGYSAGKDWEERVVSEILSNIFEHHQGPGNMCLFVRTSSDSEESCRKIAEEIERRSDVDEITVYGMSDAHPDQNRVSAIYLYAGAAKKSHYQAVDIVPDGT